MVSSSSLSEETQHGSGDGRFSSCQVNASMVTCSASVQLMQYHGFCDVRPVCIRVQLPFATDHRLSMLAEGYVSKIQEHLHNTGALRKDVLSIPKENLFLIVHLDITVIEADASLQQALFQVVGKALRDIQVPSIRTASTGEGTVVVKEPELHGILSHCKERPGDVVSQMELRVEQVCTGESDQHACTAAMITHTTGPQRSFTHMEITHPVHRSNLLRVAADLLSADGGFV